MLFLILLNISIFQGVVLGFLLLKSPMFKSKMNSYLAFAVFSLSFSFLNYVLDEFGVYESIPDLIYIDTIDSALLFPIFICLYIVHLVDHKIKDSNYIYILPIIYFFSLILNFITEFKIGNEIVILILELVNLFINILFLPFILIYTYKISQLTKSRIKQKWIKKLLLFEYLVFGSWLLLILSGLIVHEDFTILMQIVIAIATVLIHWLCYDGIYKFKIANDQKEIKKLLLARRKLSSSPEFVKGASLDFNAQKEVISKQKNKSTLQQVNVINEDLKHDKKSELFTSDNPYFIKLEYLFNTEHIYRNYSLDRNLIAQKLEISPGYLSQLVNAITGDNITTYINKHRVEAVKKMIVTPEYNDYSLLAIGLESGFASKSTFYNTFKKITGLTPNAYKKQHQ